MVDFVREWRERAELPLGLFIRGFGISASKLYSWQERYGKDNFHNGFIPRDHWLADWEKAAIIEFRQAHLMDGYRALTYMMLDRDIVAVAPATVYRVLLRAGLLRRWNTAPSRKGKGFEQPLKPHEHWHVDISYLNLGGTFYYLISVLDGCSRYVLHFDIRESMKELDVELVLQRAHELYPEARPRVISDNGPQFIAKEFKAFIRQSGMTHVRTSPYYPQSNGKLERFHRTLKHECIRPQTPASLDDAKRLVARYVEQYNNVRLHAALRYITPADKMAGRAEEIFADRDRKLEAARARRKLEREAQPMAASETLECGALAAAA